MLAKIAALRPATVRKPWGREVWYSGVEARGESAVRCGGDEVPLSRYLAAHGRAAPIVLLKLLRPAAGDLYMEVHETKHEVYVIDALDAARWPRRGAMLLGVHSGRRRALGDQALREALRARALAAERGQGSAAAVAALLESVPLRVGDVVDIPPGVPHSLLRGVDVVEFQTPLYERRILAATGPVVTQDGWDVADAVAALRLDAAARIVRGGGAGPLAQTPAFALLRLTDGDRRTVPPWSVGWVAAGALAVGACRFGAREAFVTAATASVASEPGTVAFVAIEPPSAPARRRQGAS